MVTSFFFSSCLPPPLCLPSTSSLPSTNSCFPLRQGSLSLIVNQTNSRFRPTVHEGTCPSLNHYNSSNTHTCIWLDRRSIRSNRRYREYRQRSPHTFVDNGNSTSSRIPTASRACSPSLHPERSIAYRVFFAIIYVQRRHPVRENAKRRQQWGCGVFPKDV